MKIKYTATFVDNQTISVTFEKQMIEKVENLYFYVIKDNKIVDVLTSTKQSLVGNDWIFEVKLTKPLENLKDYNILVCKNAMVKVASKQENQ